MLFRKYMATARKRGLRWAIEFEDYCDLMTRECVYCGRRPMNRVTHTYFKIRFRYQGLDRKNNKLGYTKANSVPCCGRCNSVKGKHLDYETMMLIGRVFKVLKQ